MHSVIFFRVALLGILALAAINVRADLSAKQARKAITQMAGFELPNNSVRVRKISSSGDSAAEASVEILAVFRLATNKDGRWRAVDLRTGPNQWEQLELISNAEQREALASGCDGHDMGSRGLSATEPSTKRARCLIAALLGVQLPSDVVRIKSVSPLALPLSSSPSAVIEALITVDVRFARDRKAGWLITGMRAGGGTAVGNWVNPETLVQAANDEKAKRARADLEAMARALESFRAERLSYVVSESHAVLIDHLSPRHLPRVIRLDPWHESYKYLGDRDRFTLRSLGADRKENTPDDIVITGPGR